MRINFDPRRAPGGPLGQILATLAAVVLLVLAFMFSLVVFAVLAVVGLGFWAWFWWKTRALRRQLREQAEAGAFSEMNTPPPGGNGTIIDGESVRVDDERRQLADDRDRGAPG